MSVALDRDQALMDEHPHDRSRGRGRQRRRRRPQRDASRSRRSTRCARSGPCPPRCPSELGGGGASLETVAACCLELGRSCGASAMVFAMHQILVFSIVRHLDRDSWFEPYLSELAADQRLIASVTSEIGTGGDMGRSIAALEPGEDGRCGSRSRRPPSATESTPTIF